jgi:hypothetical protein
MLIFFLPQKSRQTKNMLAGNNGASVSKVPALSIHPWRASIGIPSSHPHIFAVKVKFILNKLGGHH